MKLIAVVGLSGVGKSTLIRGVSAGRAVQHLQASALIQAEQARSALKVESPEALRLGPVLDNQALLVAAFHRLVQPKPDLVLLDGHVLIDGRDGLVAIPSDTFAAVGCEAMILLRDAPDRILARRRADTGRPRPYRSALELASQQQLASSIADGICRTLGIPLYVVTPDEPQLFLEARAAGDEPRQCRPSGR